VSTYQGIVGGTLRSRHLFFLEKTRIAGNMEGGDQTMMLCVVGSRTVSSQPSHGAAMSPSSALPGLKQRPS